MTVSTVYASVDTNVTGQSTVYATARDTGSYTEDLEADSIGQAGPFGPGNGYCMEEFFNFDTTGIPDADVISAVELAMYGSTDASTTNFKLLAAVYDYGASITTADYRNQAALQALTPIAEFDTAPAGWSTAGYNVFTELSGGLVAAINKTGNTRLVMWSDRHEAGTEATGSEYIGFWSSAEAQAGERRPRLTITHAAASSMSDPMGMSGFFGT